MKRCYIVNVQVKKYMQAVHMSTHEFQKRKKILIRRDSFNCLIVLKNIQLMNWYISMMQLIGLTPTHQKLNSCTKNPKHFYFYKTIMYDNVSTFYQNIYLLLYFTDIHCLLLPCMSACNTQLCVAQFYLVYS